MKILIVKIALAALMCASAAAQSMAQTYVLERPQPWAEIMFLGTYHFANPGQDGFNVEADDVLSERRQAEIEAIVDALAAWEPDLILVEWPRSQQANVDGFYAEYRAGGFRDRRNEIVQIGFRLADRLGHDRIAATDVRHTFYSDEQGAIDQAPGERYQALAQELSAYGTAHTERAQARLGNHTIGQVLRIMNSPEGLQANADFYGRFMIRQWQDENQGGAHTLANWHTRNILIFQNILREVEESDGRVQRVLAIYGQGHLPLLRQLAADSPWLEPVDVMPYLPE